MTGRSIALFIVAAIAEIGGAYLVWVGIKDDKGIAFVALGRHGPHRLRRRRRLPDRSDLLGAAICLIGVAVIMYAR